MMNEQSLTTPGSPPDAAVSELYAITTLWLDSLLLATRCAGWFARHFCRTCKAVILSIYKCRRTWEPTILMKAARHSE